MTPHADFYPPVMFDPKSRSYKLSGISQNFYPWRKFHAPWNENDGLLSVGNYKKIWRHRLAAPKLVQCKENIEKQSSLAGYLVHARCWREFLRVNNWHHHLTKESLGIVSRALRMRCLKECLYIYCDDPVESFLLMEPRGKFFIHPDILSHILSHILSLIGMMK